MSNTFQIGKHLSLQDISYFLKEKPKVELSNKVLSAVQKSRIWLDEYLASQSKPVYGINTGFGSLCNIKIDNDNLEKLQKNLVLSHACGIGEIIPDDIVRLMLLLKIQNMSFGYSGVQVQTIERMADMLNNDILPIVYEFGSVGASGDLAPLAHLALPLIGNGKVKYKGELMNAADAFEKAELQTIHLQSKEGLALLNGTQFMQAFGAYIVIEAQKLNNWADVIGALSLDAYDGLVTPFNLIVHNIRPHKGQIETARRISAILKDSEMIARSKDHVQDPYSFRCMPQVHGASRDAIAYVAGVIETEMHSVTDNPTLFPEENCIVSAGNFHGQPLALALDFIAIAMSELTSISERRVFRLISGKRGLPDLLVAKPGLNSGFMIPQYTAASIVTQNKVLSHPASVDTIETCQGQEDHVSMGATAALKAYKVLNNLKKVLAIELMNAAQAFEFRRPMKTSQILENLVSDYRKNVPFLDDDVYMHPLMEQSEKFIDEYQLPEL